MGVSLRNIAVPSESGFKIRGLKTLFSPSDIFVTASTLAENAPPGTLIGTLTASDVNTEDTFTYALTDSAGNRFQIVGNQLQAGPVSTNYEGAPSHQIVVRATDQTGLYVEKSFDITIVNVAEVAEVMAVNAVTSANSQSVTLTQNFTTEPGDILFAYIGTEGGDGDTAAAQDSGWVEIGNRRQTSLGAAWFYRNVDATPVGTQYAFGRASTSTRIFGRLFRIRNCSGISQETIASGNSTTLTAPSINVTGAPVRYLQLFAYASPGGVGTSLSPNGWTVAGDNTSGSYAYTRQFNTNQSNQGTSSLALNNGGAKHWISWVVKLSSS